MCALSPSLALLSHSALLADTAHFACTESHTQTGVICPSLALLAQSALLADTAHFLLAQNHTHRQASSAHHSHLPLIQRSVVVMTYNPTIHQRTINQLSEWYGDQSLNVCLALYLKA